MADETVDPLVIPDDRREAIVNLLNDKTGGVSKCPICPTGNFFLANHLVSTPVFHPSGGMILGGTTYPSLMLLCDSCGNIRLHNAMILGIDLENWRNG